MNYEAEEWGAKHTQQQAIKVFHDGVRAGIRAGECFLFFREALLSFGGAQAARCCCRVR